MSKVAFMQGSSRNGSSILGQDTSLEIRKSIQRAIYKRAGNDFQEIEIDWYNYIKAAKCVICGLPAQGSHLIPRTIMSCLTEDDAREKRIYPFTRRISSKVMNSAVSAFTDDTSVPKPISQFSKFYKLCNRHDGLYNEYEKAWPRYDNLFSFSRENLSMLASKAILSDAEYFELALRICEDDTLGSEVTQDKIDFANQRVGHGTFLGRELFNFRSTSKVVFEIKSLDLALASNLYCRQKIRNKELHYVITVFPTRLGSSHVIVHTWDSFTLKFFKSQIQQNGDDWKIAFILQTLFYSPETIIALPTWSYVLPHGLLNEGKRGLDYVDTQTGEPALTWPRLYNLLSFSRPRVNYNFFFIDCKDAYKDHIRLARDHRALSLWSKYLKSYQLS